MYHTNIDTSTLPLPTHWLIFKHCSELGILTLRFSHIHFLESFSMVLYYPTTIIANTKRTDEQKHSTILSFICLSKAGSTDTNIYHVDKNQAHASELGRRPHFWPNKRTAYHNQSGAVRTISTRDVLQRKLRYVGV